MDETPFSTMQRVVVVGSAGAGKTTLARLLARVLQVPHIELDALHWGPNWSTAPVEIFREQVSAALSGTGWIADGNYSSKVRDIVWQRADTLIWLDYSLLRVLWQVTRRTLHRAILREQLWHGNRESLREFFSFKPDSLLVWTVRTYDRRRRDFTAVLRQPEYAHLTVHHFRSPRDTARWFSALPVHSSLVQEADKQ